MASITDSALLGAAGAGGGGPKTISAIAITDSGGTPAVFVYPFTSGVGFGAKYADPSPNPGISIKDTIFSSKDIIICHNTTPTGNNLSVYSFSPISGIGSLLSSVNLGIGAITPETLAIDTNETLIAVGLSVSPYVKVLQYTPGVGTGSVYSNPSVLPNSTTRGVAFNYGSVTDIILANNNSPYVNAYAFTYAGGWGAKYSNPASLPGGGGYSASFHPSNQAVFFAHVTSGPSSYAFTSGVGFGARYSEPFSGTTAYGVSSISTDVSYATLSSPRIRTFPFNVSTGFSAQYANPSTLPPDRGIDVALTDTDVAVAHRASPYVSVYPFTSGVGYGAKYANPSVLPGTFEPTSVSFCYV